MLFIGLKRAWICTLWVLIQMVVVVVHYFNAGFLLVDSAFYILSSWWGWNVLSMLLTHGQDFVGDQQLPMQHISPLHATNVVWVLERSWYCLFGFVIGVARMRLDVMSDSFWDFSSRFIHKTYTPETFSSLRLTALTNWQVLSTWWLYVFKTAISMMYNTISQYHSPLYMHQNSINFCVYVYHNFLTQNKMYEFKSIQVLALLLWLIARLDQ